jgi:hypothetical protein
MVFSCMSSKYYPSHTHVVVWYICGIWNLHPTVTKDSKNIQSTTKVLLNHI